MSPVGSVRRALRLWASALGRLVARPGTRSRRSGLAALGLGLAIAASAAVAATVVSPAHSEDPPEVASEIPVSDETRDTFGGAAELARVLGERVEVTSERREKEAIYANPDGSRTARLFSAPVRVREDGEWRAIDPSLRAGTDELAPEAAIGDLSLSDGGSGTVAELAEDGKSVSLGLERALPRPEISGETARYRDVFGSADLELEALADGFSERLILEERPTEAPVYRFRLRTEGLHADMVSGDRVRLRDEGGKTFLLSFPARMWGADRDPATGDPKRSAPVDIDVRDTTDGQVLEIRPDFGFLSDPEVQLPITVDPTFSLGTDQDSYVMSAQPTNAAQGGDFRLETGWHPASGATPAHGRTRSYIRVPTDTIEGKNVLSAKVRLHQFDANSCLASKVEARRVGEYWHNTGLSWNSQPATSSAVQGYTGSNEGGGTSCPRGNINLPITESLAQQWADRTLPNYGLVLRAVEGMEDEPNTLKSFASANHPDYPPPYLDVAYNSYPATPSYRSPGWETAPGPELGDATPTFSARFSDPDGGTGKVQYQVFDATTNELVRDSYGATVSSASRATGRRPPRFLTTSATTGVPAATTDRTTHAAGRRMRISLSTRTITLQHPRTSRPRMTRR